ncbi:RING finger and transmembrane domain-containing protein [Arachis hypogaea]|nr:RING finger and transmembrane domain-containing protein [Arachis hypogaea]
MISMSFSWDCIGTRLFIVLNYLWITSSLVVVFLNPVSVGCQVQAFFAAVKALSQKEVHYGSYATSEQVIVAGDLCAICQEKMHAPILLHCKHIFCEDCVSEW